MSQGFALTPLTFEKSALRGQLPSHLSLRRTCGHVTTLGDFLHRRILWGLQRGEASLAGFRSCTTSCSPWTTTREELPSQTPTS